MDPMKMLIRELLTKVWADLKDEEAPATIHSKKLLPTLVPKR